MERDLAVFLCLGVAMWRYVHANVSSATRSVVPFDAASEQLQTGDLLLFGDCGRAGGWAASLAGVALRMAEMSPWVECGVVLRGTDGAVQAWLPGAGNSVLPLAEAVLMYPGCAALRPLLCSAQQRAVLDGYHEAVIGQIRSAGAANLVDAVSSYAYRYTNTNNPRPAHTGLTPAESVAFFYQSCGVLQLSLIHI